jgi:hypothetical protein
MKIECFKFFKRGGKKGEAPIEPSFSYNFLWQLPAVSPQKNVAIVQEITNRNKGSYI